MYLPRLSGLLAFATLVAGVLGAATSRDFELEDRASGTKYVFAHFSVGIVASYAQSDWTNDMQLAQAIGIDGFALNIGTDSYNAQQLGYAYAAAEALGFKVFLSFDFGYWNSGDTSEIASYVNTYGVLPAQFIYNNEIFVSTFVGDGFNWATVASQSKPLYACPNYQAASLAGSSGVSCLFSWDAWASTDNQPIDQNKTTAGDVNYINTLGSDAYMMPVSPWFFTHYGPSSYNKNWHINPIDYELRHLSLPDIYRHEKKTFTQGKAQSYAPVQRRAQRKCIRFPHDAWRDVAAPYIAAYKAGATSPTVTTEELVYYYRPNPKGAGCSDSVTQPTGYEYDGDSIFVIAMTQSAGTVVITSGSTSTSINVPAGITTVSAPMGTGVQSFALTRSGATILSGTSALQVSSSCTVYNFNAYVGSVTGGGGTSSGGGGTSSGTVAVTFSVYAITTYGENIFLTGSISQLGDWSPTTNIPLSSATYPTWTVTVDLPADTAFEYKMIRQETSGAWTWESDPNRSATTVASGSQTIADTWS
ncbi:carbohydrate-binding module family 20 protein [Athelia psychrophila]|uniref:Carbohydrate-binding module family 20 protein n=1 Tax=Athelia psychrophila TaxID=1759441 RepID=A0A165YF24_9AGAM|nr:carbohydrate-binding module family 20 protein [Fibularhizoctonia sp. CBS 109695]